MSLVLLGTTSRSGLSVEQVGGNDVYKMFPQLQAILEQEGCPGRSLFAEPQEAGRDIDWYVETTGKVSPLGKLSPEEQNKLISSLDSVFDQLKSCAAKLRKNGLSGANYADIIEKALVCPADMREKVIYSVDGQPVMTCWGFSDGNLNLVDGIKDLAKQIQRNLQSNTAQPEVKRVVDLKEQEEPEKAVEPESAQAEEKPAGAGPAVSQQKQAEPAPVSAEEKPAASEPVRVEEKPVEPTAAAQAPAKSGHWFLPLLVCALLVLAALAIWYFLFADQSGDAPVFQGRLESRSLFTNAQNEKVDLLIEFDNGTNLGRVVVKEPNQTCSGDIAASRPNGNNLFFKVDRIMCPNGDHYDPFTLECGNDPHHCDFVTSAGTRRPFELK